MHIFNTDKNQELYLVYFYYSVSLFFPLLCSINLFVCFCGGMPCCCHISVGSFNSSFEVSSIAFSAYSYLGCQGFSCLLLYESQLYQCFVLFFPVKRVIRILIKIPSNLYIPFSKITIFKILVLSMYEHFKSLSFL